MTKKAKKKNKRRMPAMLSFIITFLIIGAAAAVHNGRYFGHTLGKNNSVGTETVSGNEDIINTTEIGKDINGYAGPIPLEIHMKNGRIDSIHVLTNSESPGFFNRLIKNGYLHSWDGMTPQEALAANIDAVSGATFSSNGVKDNVHAAMTYLLDTPATESDNTESFEWKLLAAIVVILTAALIPLKVHDRRFRIAQQLLNVGVLGFWCGTFIDYAMLMKFFSSGLTMSLATAVTVLLLIVGFIYPLFGKANYYCNWVCPFGSIQDLAGLTRKNKWHIGSRTARILDNARQALWLALTLLLFIGAGTAWIDNEIFTAFIVESASWFVIGAGILFIVLSIFVQRPFCRFICPTGSLLKITSI